MLPTILLFSALISAQASAAIFNLQKTKPNDLHPAVQLPVINTPGMALPAGQENEKYPSDEVILSDMIARERSINIFAGFVRDIDPISARLEDSSQRTTVLAPSNSEIQKLPRKPWEDARDYGILGSSAYAGSDGEDRAHANLRRFVETHIIGSSLWKEGQKIQTLGGQQIWWESVGGKKIVRSLRPGKALLTLSADSAQGNRGFEYSYSGFQWRSMDSERSTRSIELRRRISSLGKRPVVLT